jgi:hypothetical protein
MVHMRRRIAIAAAVTAVATGIGAHAAAAAVPTFNASFEGGNCSEFSQGCKTSGSGTYSVASSGAYSGSRYLRASVSGNSGVSFARAQTNISISLGSDFWFGSAVRLKTGFYNAGGQVRLFAWDTYPASPTQRGGIWIDSTGRVVVYRHSDNGGQVPLVILGNRAIPEGKWVWIELHQRLSTTDGQALTEVFMDGVSKGSSTARNINGGTVTRYRVGITDASAAKTAITADFDRAYLGTKKLGPLGSASGTSTSSGGTTSGGTTSGGTTSGGTTSGGTTSGGTTSGGTTSGGTSSTPLQVSILNPADGATVSGYLKVSVSTSGRTASSVRLYLDGSLVAIDNSSPFGFGLWTSKVANGTHTIKVVAIASDGSTAADQHRVKFSN